MKLKYLILLALAVLGLMALIVSKSGENESAKEEKADRSSRRIRLQRKQREAWTSAKEAVRMTVDGRVPKSKKLSKSPNPPNPATMFDHLKPADRKVAWAVQNALDVEDFDGVVRASEQALRSADPELRKHAVEAIGWFGAEALPELTPLVADADEDVAEVAADKWQEALSMIDDDELRIATAEVALKTMSNENALNLIVSEITGQSDELKIVQSLVDIIDSGNPVGVKIAEEEYELLTNEKWTGIDGAESWLEQNYEPEGGAQASE